jgi:hypothetical protein
MRPPPTLDSTATPAEEGAMKHVLIAVCGAMATAAAALTAATTPAAFAGSHGHPPCTPKVTKVHGHPAALNCGPATATLHIGGKTYTFRNGLCQQSKSAGAALSLDLGTTVIGVKGNAGKPHFNIDVVKNVRNGSVGADYGGKTLIDDGLVTVNGKVPAGGTFSSKFSGPGFGPSFMGSWNCHGVIWQSS